jgi:hypothetical protein
LEPEISTTPLLTLRKASEGEKEVVAEVLGKGAESHIKQGT